MLKYKWGILCFLFISIILAGCSGRNPGKDEKSEKFQSDYMDLGGMGTKVDEGLFYKLLYCIKNQWNQEIVEKYLELVGLNPKSKKAVGKYSLGMKQRLAIAQAIMEGQDILILDEPMNGLDNQGVEDIRKLLFQLKKEGKTILLASHSKEDICVLCEQVYEMDKGILTKQEKLAERDNIWDNNKKAEENK
ncbi:MAG: ATP-binding cassette domain-containing protein [Faecalimonas sp.]|nr:ATP-binding cassette domain-containing protein [Faecalimonas sp.]